MSGKRNNKRVTKVSLSNIDSLFVKNQNKPTITKPVNSTMKSSLSVEKTKPVSIFCSIPKKSIQIYVEEANPLKRFREGIEIPKIDLFMFKKSVRIIENARLRMIECARLEKLNQDFTYANYIVPYTLHNLIHEFTGVRIREHLITYCTLGSLNFDMLLYIVQFMNLKEVIKLSQTCRSFYCLMTSDIVLRKFSFVIEPLLEKIKHPKTKTLSVVPSYDTVSIIYKKITFAVKDKKRIIEEEEAQNLKERLDEHHRNRHYRSRARRCYF